MPYCVHCGGNLEGVRIFRQTPCPHCDAHLHACVQCKFHEPTAHNQCLEPQAEQVADREKANFCEFFRIAGAAARAPGRSASPGASEDRAKDARAKLEQLFKKPGDD
jgi:hypothetical protein